MNSVRIMPFLILGAAGLQGCTSPGLEQQLQEASAAYEQVSQDARVVHDAPKDVMRAGDSLERAKRFAGYLGNAEDAEHYAYLSQRYSEIARNHSALQRNQMRATQLAMEQERLRQTLQEARVLDAHQQDRWLDEQMISMAAAESDRGLVMTLGDVLFKPASAELGNSANRTLLKLAHFLQLNPGRRIRIEGYTDNRGDAAENLQLSRARAQAVADFLVDLGIEASRMEVLGYGEQHRISENASARGRAQNRRVEILFSDDKGRLSPPR